MHPTILIHVLQWVSCVVLCGGFSSAALGVVRYVDDSAPGNGGGSSWASPFNTLQAALAMAVAGDEIRVGQGLYKPGPPGSLRTSTFLIPTGVKVKGGYAGFGAIAPEANDPAIFPTVCSGDLNGDDGPLGTFTNQGDNAYHVFRIHTANGNQIENLTIRAGSADFGAQPSPNGLGGGLYVFANLGMTLTNCRVEYCRAYEEGGGVWLNINELTLTGCTFLNNRSIGSFSLGGGVWSGGLVTATDSNFISNRTGVAIEGGGAISAPIVHASSCDFKGNSESAIVCGSASEFQSCRFKSNFSFYGGAVNGGGTFRDCLFMNNLSERGGALYVRSGLTGAVLNCRFIRNGAYEGAALHNGGSLTAINCFFVGGDTSQSGVGSVLYNTGFANFDNCTAAENTSDANNFGTAVYQASGSLHLSNCIFWGNTVDGVTGEAANVRFFGGNLYLYSCIVQGWTGNLNGSDNNADPPIFQDLRGHDNVIGTLDDNPFQTYASAAWNTGSNSSILHDDYDIDLDGDTFERLPHDLTGRGRISGPLVDRGCTELREACPADIIADNTVNVQDLLAVISGWGTCLSYEDCVADIAPLYQGDRMVGVQELLAVIYSWGSCVAVTCTDDAAAPSADSAFVAHAGGTFTAACCSAVCMIDPFCCEMNVNGGWDADCVAIALATCGHCGDSKNGACDIVHGSPGCNDSACCGLVCSVDPFCCTTAWDAECVELASFVCP